MNVITRILSAFTITAMFAPFAHAKVDFVKQVKPVLEAACVNCHGAADQDGDLRLDTLEHLLKGGDSGPAIVKGDPDKSLLIELISLSADDDDVMPPKDPPLASSQIAVLKDWIKEGAEWPEGEVLTATPRIDFVKHIQPIFEQNCITCHNPNNEGKSDYHMTTLKEAQMSN